MTGAEALRLALPLLRDAEIPDAARDARLLLSHAMGVPADRLTLHLHDDMTEQAVSTFQAAITARTTRQPLSQITGSRLFWGLRFKVTQDTLDPRPETEILVQEAVSRPFVNMLDLGTGTGCILLSCLHGMAMAQGIGTDVSEAALAVAAQNAQLLNLGRRARFLPSDWFANVQGRFDLITSNPPYIAAAEMAALSPEVRNWEPHLALTPGGDGLDAYRIIARGAGARLLSGGRLLVEIGPSQAQAVSDLFRQQGLEDIRILKDLDGRDRVVCAVKQGDPADCGSA